MPGEVGRLLKLYGQQPRAEHKVVDASGATPLRLALWETHGSKKVSELVTLSVTSRQLCVIPLPATCVLVQQSL